MAGSSLLGGNGRMSEKPEMKWMREPFSPIYRRSTSYVKFIFASCVTIMLLYTMFSWMGTAPRPQLFTDRHQTLADPAITQILQKLYQPLIPAVDQKRWKDIKGETWTIDIEDPHFKKPLGKDLLILDIDSRPKRRKEDIGFRGRMDWDDMTYLTAGMMNHYTYAQIHGYDYQFMQPDQPDDRWGTWAKVGAMRAALRKYKYIVFLDGDALFSHPELPLEWLMNHWDIDSDTAFAMPREPREDQNIDLKGNYNVNTGFVIAQQHHILDELFDAWLACPDDDSPYEGCDKFKNDFPHEQGVMSSFIRYDYEPYIKELPCVEANGSPNAPSSCNGTFISHFWWNKDSVIPTVAAQMAQVVMERAHAHFIEEGW